MMHVISDEAGLTHKLATTADERQRLHQEAGVLRLAAHPGIVQLVGTEGADPPAALVLRTVPGGNLSTLGPQPAAVVAGLGAALATTVADLHALGFSHGAIAAEHVLLDEGGRPVLCSLGRGERSVERSANERLCTDDVHALARMLLDLVPSAAPTRVTRILQGVARPHRRARTRRLRPHDARWLARRLVAAAPDARLPDKRNDATGDSPTGTDEFRHPSVSGRPLSGGRRRRLVVLASGACVVILGAVLWLPGQMSSHRPRANPAPSGRPLRSVGAETASCPAVDDGCGPVATPGGILTTRQGRYEVGDAGEVVVLGRWHCGSAALPAVLRPGTGEVWTFDSWPTPDHGVVGSLATRAASAWTLRVGPQPSGCDRLLIERRGLRPLAMFGSGP